MAYENLYDSLRYNIQEDDLNKNEKNYLTEFIMNLDIEQKEIIYLLILHDYIKNNPNTKVIYPYKTKQITNDKIEIKLDALPNRIKRILFKFCKLIELSNNSKKEFEN
jgi:hypothetical protein